MALPMCSILFPRSRAITLGPNNPNGQMAVRNILDTSRLLTDVD